jgi:soluble lytic murein transglycosylase-like protein
LVALGLCLALPAGARADIYKCKGPNGGVHYTNSRPSGARCKRIVRSSSSSSEQKKRQRQRARQRQSERSSNSSAPGRAQRYLRHIQKAAQLYQLPAAFLRAVMKVESDYTPRAVSHAGAMGLMQLMPQTAAAMGVRNPFDPKQNILGGARYLRVLANKFNGDLVLTIAAYNAGEGAVVKHGGVPPYRETRRYVRNVLERYHAFRSGEGSSQRARASQARKNM